MKLEFVPDVRYQTCLCSSVSARLLSRWMGAVKKGKVYENERQIIHTSTYKHTPTHTSTPACPALHQETICLGKPKKGLSVYFTLEIKLGFKWMPLTRGHICSVTNFTLPSSPGGSPSWPHPGNLWPPFAWTKRAEGKGLPSAWNTVFTQTIRGINFWFLGRIFLIHNPLYRHY